MDRKRIQPTDMINSPAFSQGIEVSNHTSTLYIGGQNSIDSNGQVVGKDSFSQQCEQALLNVKAVLESGEYTINHVVNWTIYIVQGNDVRLGFQAFQKVFGVSEIPPTIVVIQVTGLASVDCLVEISGIAIK